MIQYYEVLFDFISSHSVINGSSSMYMYTSQRPNLYNIPLPLTARK